MSKHIFSRCGSFFHAHWRRLMVVAVFSAVLSLFTGFVTAKNTYLISDGDTIYSVDGYSCSVGEAFIRAGVVLDGDDRYEAVEKDYFIRVNVIRKTVTDHSFYETIPYQTFRQANPNLPVGTERLAQKGKSGVRATVAQITAVTGQAPFESFCGISTIAQPVDEIIEYGTMVEPVAQSFLSVTDDVLASVNHETGTIATVSGQELSYSKVISCTATAYTTERQSWKITATGTTARIGAIAVDPRVIPYGTRMYIVSSDGSITYGIATAEDCGGAIKGNRIDLFFNTYAECIQFGRRPCTVYILN